MKCAICGLVEAGCEFEVKSIIDGSTIQEAVSLCWACLDQRMTSLTGEKESLECAHCGHTIHPKSSDAMKDKDGRVFCDVNCACDFYIDTMRLVYIKWDKAETEENNNDNNT